MSEHDLDLHVPTYEWSVRVFHLLRRLVRLTFNVHAEDGAFEDGDIFLFNHFARFETFIPQYFIHERTGAYCRSVASAEFFDTDDPFATYLKNVGAVPNTHPRLLAFLALEALRGRKIVIFPEGGMVKDRRVLDPDGHYRVYSRTADIRRGHHTGAAVLGLGLALMKEAIRGAAGAGEGSRLEAWADAAGFESAQALVAAAERPTRLVPANITFYPIRVRDNLLRRGAELINRGLSKRLAEELLIEGNILLRDTDMDIRLGAPIVAERRLGWLDRTLARTLWRRLDRVDALFDATDAPDGWRARWLSHQIRRQAGRTRDEYMHRMYTSVTVNQSHLISILALSFVDRADFSVEEQRFRDHLYRFIKAVQREPSIHLHESLRNPDAYAALHAAESRGLRQLVDTAVSTRLVERHDGCYRFLPKLREEHGFDDVRLENPIEVYANEVSPLGAMRRCLARAVEPWPDSRAFAHARFHDESLSLAWDRARFDRAEHQAINRLETADSDPSPFLIESDGSRGLGVLLVHGFLASPAELRAFGELLGADGYAVHGVRLKGHGTSPWDLRERSWTDWLASVRAGYEVLSALVPRVAVVGFSTGGALGLALAADRPPGLAGVAAVSAPMRFRHPGMAWVRLMHGANELVRRISSADGLRTFQRHASEHPRINYQHMPVRGLNELQQMVATLDERLLRVACPVLLVQAERDPVVDPASVAIIAERLVAVTAEVVMIEADRHGILHEDVGATRASVRAFLARIEAG